MSPEYSKKEDFTYPLSSPLFDGDHIKCHPVPTLWNGRYQQLFWLGVNGYVIVNHEDLEVLLVDPWSSYRKKVKKLTHREAIDRLESLVNFVRRGYAEGYRVAGVLVSHEHFDHTRDIPLIYNLLTKANGKSGKFNLEGQRLTSADLPPILCDLDSKTILSKAFADYTALKRFAKWEIIAINKEAEGWVHPHYRDSYNRDLCAGTVCRSVLLGSFEITPYVWDHLTVFEKDVCIGQLSGNLQRISAFQIKKSGVDNAKRTFVVGSSGEMSRQYTQYVRQVPIETDLLIQSLTPNFPPFEQKFSDMMAYQHQNITIKDCIVCSHWEHFTGSRPASKKRFKSHDFEKVKKYIGALKNEDRQKTFVLARSCFEMPAPKKPTALRLL